MFLLALCVNFTHYFVTMNKILFVFCLFLTLYSNSSVAHNDHEHEHGAINYIKNNLSYYDYSFQKELRSTTAWRNFIDRHPTWFAVFNEENRKPHRAYGKGIETPAALAPEQKAIWFIQNELAAFEIPVQHLNLISLEQSDKHYFVHFEQRHQGLPVINSHIYVKMSLSGQVVLFALNYYHGINTSIAPTVNENVIKEAAQKNLHGLITDVSVDAALRILTIAQERKASHHLVYTANVQGTDDGLPFNYEAWVDAHTGVVHHRANKVLKLMPDPIKVQINGNIFPLNQNNSPVTRGMSHIRVRYGNGMFAFANDAGLIDVPVAAGDTVTFELAGRWSTVRHTEAGVLLPSFRMPLFGDTTVNWNLFPNSPLNPASIRHVNAYYHTSIMHDTMKRYLPSFTGLDVSLATLVDRTDGSCNAFYDGSSVNYYVTQGGCAAFSQIADVVYHEYGHGITNRYYSSRSVPFQNGAMGEGYSDAFAIMITGYPVVGEGRATNGTGFIRRYDNVTKRYPENIIGQVHNDGEIICGAWWKTNLAIGNRSYVQKLVYHSMLGLPMAPNGQEGRLYGDILLEAITSDDDDNDLSNGTPFGTQIINAFRQHGINLFNDADIFHTPPMRWAAQTPITIQCDAVVPSARALALFKQPRFFYKLNNATSYIDTNMVLFDPIFSTYTVDLPAQPKGTIIYYYFAMEDVFGNLFQVYPRGANLTGNLNYLPEVLLVGFNPIITENFEQPNPNWQLGIATDNAIEGQWIIDAPVSSQTPEGIIVQTGFQNTNRGLKCAITANAPSPTSDVNAADVDNGRTTLQSPDYDLSNVQNPAISYYRWFTNNTGLGPNRDNWTVLVSNDGVNYVVVERTAGSDRAWRRNVFRVADFVTPSTTVSLRFVAEDVAAPSTVEAGLDDVVIFEEATNVGIETIKRIDDLVRVFPNPANNFINIHLEVTKIGHASIQVVDILGKTVINNNSPQLYPGQNQLQLNTSALAAGTYMLKVITPDGLLIKPIVVSKK